MSGKFIEINKQDDDYFITQKMEKGKVIIVVIDGIQKSAKVVEACEHGKTILQTVKGKAAKIKHESEELYNN